MAAGRGVQGQDLWQLGTQRGGGWLSGTGLNEDAPSLYKAMDRKEKED